MRSEQEFRSFFRCVTDNDAYPYQVRLASEPNTPRHLVYCLSMRALVEVNP